MNILLGNRNHFSRVVLIVIEDLRWHFFHGSQGSTLSIWGCFSKMRGSPLSWKPRAEERDLGPKKGCAQATFGPFMKSFSFLEQATCPILWLKIDWISKDARYPLTSHGFIQFFENFRMTMAKSWANRPCGVLAGVLAKQDLVIAGPGRCDGPHHAVDGKSAAPKGWLKHVETCWNMLKHVETCWNPGNHGIPSGYAKIAMENDHLQWFFPWKMVIFHSYVKLPEGKS